jgi:hypothetical protein
VAPVGVSMHNDAGDVDRPSKPRGRFQFGLRTALIAVALLSAACAYFLANGARIVLARSSLRKSMERNGMLFTFIDPKSAVGRSLGVRNDAVPLLRRWLGDSEINFIIVSRPITDGDAARIEQSFPNAETLRIDKQQR